MALIYRAGALQITDDVGYVATAEMGNKSVALDWREVTDLRDALTDWLERIGRAEG